MAVGVEFDSGVALADLGYEHLYWCILRHVAAANVDPYDMSSLRTIAAADMPRHALKAYSGLSIGQPKGAIEASYSPLLKSEPFEMAARFVAVRQADGTLWYGQPVLLFQVETLGKVVHDLAYIKWLSNPFQGSERDILPVPSDFLCMQWAVVDKMGLDSKAWQPQSFGVVPITWIVHVAPIMQIGTVEHVLKALNPHRAALAKCALINWLRHEYPTQPSKWKLMRHWPWILLRKGPLYVLNPHVYMSPGTKLALNETLDRNQV
jgi:hypothetical protein